MGNTVKILAIDRPLAQNLQTHTYNESTIKRFRLNKFECETLERGETVWRDDVAFFIQETNEAGA